MQFTCKWLLILSVTCIYAQDPRKKSLYDGILLDEDVSCASGNCVKRSGPDDFGPFWANRGKKDPNYTRSPLYAQEPQWIIVRRGEKITEDLPFYIARGKKNALLWSFLQKHARPEPEDKITEKLKKLLE